MSDDRSLISVTDGPWTDEQVQGLNEYQEAGWFHPYTCGSDSHEHHVNLRATPNGWVCPECPYTQGWAWGWTMGRGPL